MAENRDILGELMIRGLDQGEIPKHRATGSVQLAILKRQAGGGGR